MPFWTYRRVRLQVRAQVLHGGKACVTELTDVGPYLGVRHDVLSQQVDVAEAAAADAALVSTSGLLTDGRRCWRACC